MKNKRLNLLNNIFEHNKSTFKFNSMLKSFSFKSQDIGKTVYDGVLFNELNPNLMEVKLNQPKKLNSLDLKMIKTILKKVRMWVPYNIDGWSSEGEINQNKKLPNVIVFTGEGKNFCAGGDIKSLYTAKQQDPKTKIVKDFFRYEYLLDYSLTKMTPIQVSLWQGAVMGGGVGLSINSPVKICTDSTVFAMPESKIGLFTDVGASYFLQKNLNNSVEVALYVGLTGDKITGKNLAVTGVATHYFSPENFNGILDILKKEVNEKTNLSSLQELINKKADYVYDSKNFTFPNYDLIKYVFQPSTIQTVFKRLNNLKNQNKEELKENFLNSTSKEWAESVLNDLNTKSPLSLCAIFELIKRGQEFASLEEALDLEAQVVSGFMEDSDFFEGVRALLVEKDNKPVWKHKSIDEINHKEMVQKYFDVKEQIDINPNL